jgi:two-component system sensor histidine kinase KdpD
VSDSASWRDYLRAGGVVVLATAVALALRSRLQAVDAAMLLLLGVVAAASWTRVGPAIAASVLSIAAFDLLFVPPYYTFSVGNTAYILTFVVMLVVAIAMSRLTARVREEALAASERERRTAAAFSLSRALADAAPEALVPLALAAVREAVGREPEMVSETSAAALDDVATRVAFDWAVEHGLPAGRATAHCAEAEALVIPVRTAVSRHGALIFRAPVVDDLPSASMVLTASLMADQLAVALERAGFNARHDAARTEVEAERLRTALLSSLSHDLRTPLAAIEGSASSLLQGADVLSPDDRRDLADAIVQESRRMTGLVTNLLDMVRVEAGALAVKKEWQPLEEALGVALLRLDERLGGHLVTTALPAGLPLVPVDGLLIEQVFINLLENAVKYTPGGGKILIELQRDGSGVLVRVRDPGIGLPDGMAERIFEPFGRAANAAARHLPGLGLGLYICRQIVEQHGGRLWAESPGEDLGMTMTMWLPAAEAPEARQTGGA